MVEKLIELLDQKITGLLPPDMARKAEDIGVNKAKNDFLSTLVLSILAGAFIALGAIFATTVLTGTSGIVPWGWARFVAGLAFSLGLILVIVGGAELFTGNNLIVMAWASKRVSTKAVIGNWVIVYIGNLIGSLGTAVLIFLSKQYEMANGSVGHLALNIGLSKVHLDFIPAIVLGILCNSLVCLAVWLTYSATTTVGRILAIIFPISAFVASGFEHCVANMYFIPVSLFIKDGATPSFWNSIGMNPADYADLTWWSFINANLIPVTIGNIIGGSLLVGAVYWIVYLRKSNSTTNL